MASGDSKPQEGDAASKPPSPSFSENWKERILLPTLVAGAGGGGYGLVSKHRTVQGFPHISAACAANFAIVAGCYCGAREFVRVTRKSGPDDLLNSAIAGFSTGALLGRLQGGQLGALRYSFIFAIAGTSVDFATIKLRPKLRSLKESIFGDEKNKGGGWKLPVWSPIQVLDEDALAKKEAREKQRRVMKKQEDPSFAFLLRVPVIFRCLPLVSNLQPVEELSKSFFLQAFPATVTQQAVSSQFSYCTKEVARPNT